MHSSLIPRVQRHSPNTASPEQQGETAQEQDEGQALWGRRHAFCSACHISAGVCQRPGALPWPRRQGRGRCEALWLDRSQRDHLRKGGLLRHTSIVMVRQILRLVLVPVLEQRRRLVLSGALCAGSLCIAPRARGARA
ncbi:unnamed protein product [Prorocentrum cordatum]|uniref:Uncharacterized protein n=1 Tax=Prorocentrum cordatum TaxID=2364126 RepID=A0ABN9WRR9_9DINO|nr:unnamed protein product [Polarella glacialis]